MAVALKFAANGEDVQRFWRAIGEGAQQAGRQVSSMARFWEEAARAAKAAQKAMDDAVRKPVTHIRALNAGIRDVRSEVEGLASRLGPAGSALSAFGVAGAAVGAGLAVIGAGYVKAVQSSRVFEKQISQLAAITGASGKDLQFLREQSLAFGRDTTASATQVAEAFKLIASAKPELLASGEALAIATRQAITLSEAAGQALPDAARALTTALNQFGAGADQAGRFINVLAAGAQKGAVEIPDLTIALVKAGTEARGAGLSFEQTVAIVEELGKFGTPLEKVGTSLRNIFLKLQEGADATNPAVVGITAALKNLQAEQLSAAELTKLFGTENVTVASQLLKVADSANDLTEAITGTNAAQEQAVTATDNLDGSLAKLGNAWDALNISIGNSNGLIKSFVDGVRGALELEFDPGRIARFAVEQARAREIGGPGKDAAVAAAEKALLEQVVGSAEATFAPRQFVGPPARPPADVAREEALLGKIAGVSRDLDKAGKTKIDKVKDEQAERLKAIDDGLKAQLISEKEAGAERVRINAQAEKEIAEIRATEAKKGASGEAKGVAERKKLLETLADAKREAELAGLDEIGIIEKKRDQAIAKYADEVAKQKDAAQLLAEYRVAQEEIAADKIADIRAKADATAQKAAERAAEQQAREAEKVAEEQGRALQGIVTDVTGLLAEGLVESFAAGKEAAFDWGETFSGIIKRLAVDLAQALLIQGVVAPLVGGAAGGANATGAGGGILSLLVGGGGGGGSLLTTGASLLSGNGGGSGGGILGALFGGGGGSGAAAGTSGDFLSSLFGGGGSSIANTPTFGAPSLLQQSLGLFGGSGAGALGGAGASAGSAFGSQFLTQIPESGVLIAGSGVDVFSQAAGSGVLLPEGATAGGSAVSGASVLAAYAGLAISLGLAAKGLIDSRKQLDAATLGTGNSSKNALTGLGAGLVVGGVAAGAAIGTAVYPGLGTVVGAGVGAAVGSAISNAINSGVAAGTSTAVRAGLDQAGLEKAVAKKTGDDIILNILSGYANKVFIADILGPAFSPSIEKIFAKVFRQSIGGPGGLDTDGVTGEGNYGLGANRGQAGQAARIIAQAFGAGGDAFGTNREGRFVSLLLGGIRKRLTKEGLSDDAAYREIAEAFAGAFNGKLLNAFDAAFKGRAAQRPDDVRFIAEQFAAGAPSYGFDYQGLAADVLESGRVPGKPARRQSREVIGQALAAGIENPTDPRAFARSAQGGFIGVATEAFSKALSSSSLGVGLAEVFAPDKNDRKALRRAKKAGDAEVADVLAAQFSKSVGKFVERISDPAYPKAIAAFSDELFKLGIALSEATGDTAGARAQLDERLAPFRAQVDAIDQAGRDVRSRSAFALAGPGFAGTEAQIAELTRQRQDAARDLRSSAVLDIGSGSIEAGLRGLGGVAAGDIGIAATEVQAYAEARLAELEAQIALERQIVDLLEQATDALHGLRGQAQAVLGTFDSRAEAARTVGLAQTSFAAARGQNYSDPVTLGKFLDSLSTAISTTANRFQFLDQAGQGFTGLADQLALATGGRRAGRRQLASKRGEVDALVATALGQGQGSDAAIGDLQRLLPEILQLGQQVLSPGQLRRLQKQIGGTASSLGIGLGNEADTARGQLTALEQIAAQAEIGSGSALDLANTKLGELKADLVLFRDAVTPALDYLGGVAREQLHGQLEEMIRLLGPASPQLPYLQGIAAHFGVGPVSDPTAYDPAGARPVAAPPGWAFGFGNSSGATNSGGRSELVITIRDERTAAGKVGPKATLNGRTLGSAEGQAIYDVLKKTGLAA